MEEKALEKIRSLLERVLKELTSSKIVDSKLRSKYAEYAVAHVLAKKGHQVQLSNERNNKNADIYIADKQKRVEVKSGKYDDEWTDASFGYGNQISDDKFDYCVFVTFDKDDDSEIKEMFVFTRNELKDVAKPRKKIADFPKTNPCLLLRCQNFKDYEEAMKTEQKLKIEIDLNRHPEKYNRAWNKIK